MRRGRLGKTEEPEHASPVSPVNIGRGWGELVGKFELEARPDVRRNIETAGEALTAPYSLD